MTFLLTTRRTDGTEQNGLPTNTYSGAASAHAALADASTSSYVRIAARARLDSQVMRLSVQAPVLNISDRVYSVRVRVQVRSIVPVTVNEALPSLLLWLRTESGEVTVSGQAPVVAKIPYDPITAPTDPITSAWHELDLGDLLSAPGGVPWDQNGNLQSLSVEIGRNDDEPAALDIAAIFFDVYYQQASTVTPAGPVDGEETSPPVTWTYDSPNFAPQQGHRHAVYTEDQTLEPDFVPFLTPALFISGLPGGSADTSWWLIGEDQYWQIPGDLTDGTYVAFTQATSQWAGGGGDFYTDIESITWTRDGSTASPPNSATLTSVEYDRAEMGNMITFEPDGATDAYTVERRTDGTEGGWAPISPGYTRFAADGLNPMTVKDRFMPLNSPAEYRVVSFAGSPLVSALEPSNVVTETAADERYIFRHPTNDLLDVAIVIKNPKAEEGIERTKREMSGIAYFTGGPGTKALPVMQFGPTYGWEYDLNLLFVTVDDPTLWAKVDQLHEARVPIFFQLPTNSEQMWGGLGPGASGRDVKEKLTHMPGNAAQYMRILRNTTFTETVAPETFI